MSEPAAAIQYWFVVTKHGAEHSRVSADIAAEIMARELANGGDWQAAKDRLMQYLDRAQRA